MINSNISIFSELLALYVKKDREHYWLFTAVHFAIFFQMVFLREPLIKM